VGEEYGVVMPWGTPLFILGESHYGFDAGSILPRDFTRDIVREATEGVGYPFLTKAVGVFDGVWPDHEIRRRFWRTSVFYNFIQESAGEEARVRPTREMWRRAMEPLEETLILCMPGFVLVLGTEMWQSLPLALKDGPPVSCDGQTKVSRLYFNDNGYAFTFGIDHPSSFGWSYSRWTPWVRAALAEAIRFQNS
jgi:hypothetical protein